MIDLSIDVPHTQGIRLKCLACSAEQTLYLGNYGYEEARTLLGLIDGSSKHYLFPKDNNCATCGGNYQASLFGFREAS